MTNYRANPQETRKEFEILIDKIACCVSSDDVEKVATILKVKNEWMDYNSNLLRTSLNTTINMIFEDVDMEKKLQYLDKLASENKENAWRPQTGNPDLTSFEGKHLHKEVKKLKKSIKLLKKESSLIKEEVLDFRNRLQEQQMEIKKYINPFKSLKENS